MPWYYAEGPKQIGPVDDATFEGLVSTGVIRADTLVWQTGMANWLQFQAVRASPGPPPIHPAAEETAEMRYCSECGKPYPAADLVTFGTSSVCAACKPLFTQKLVEGVRPLGSVQFGGFWIRFGATFIDGILMNIVMLILFGIGAMFMNIDWMNLGRAPADVMQILALEGGFFSVSLVLGAVYETWFVGRFGATPGKIVCQLKVVKSGGGQVSYLLALGRHFAKFLNTFTLGIGYIMAGIDDEKRALHDRICDTRVIKK
jgi:uncharacterized RDD family membrane protein YckC